MKKWLLSLIAVLLMFTPVQAAELCTPAIQYASANTQNIRIPVLAYHSVKPQRFYYPVNADNPWILHEDIFRAQMQYLYDNGFTPLTSHQLVNFLFHGTALPPNPIVLTFDDGYLDNALFAAPILREFGFTAMLFLITGAIEETTPTMVAWPTPFMSRAEIFANMDVFEFGSHSHAMHCRVNGIPLLVSESTAAIRADILLSFEYPLTFTTGFAFPFGRHSQNALQALQETGILFAFTTFEAYLTRNTNPLLIPRFQVTSDWDMQHFSNVVNGR